MERSGCFFQMPSFQQKHRHTKKQKNMAHSKQQNTFPETISVNILALGLLDKDFKITDLYIQ